jgi:membrane associated rhomboid family serine protease
VIPLKDNIPTDRFPLVTVALVAANVIVYLLSIRHGGSLVSGPATHEVIKYGAIPYALTHPSSHCGIAPSLGAFVCTRGAEGTSVISQFSIPAWQTVFTSMFMHGSLFHLAGNMLFLWIFGNNVEDAMGRLKFLAFYLLGGVAALALQVAIHPDSLAPTIGASGAIAAVLGGYMLLYPRARVITLVIIILFVTVIELPALVVLVFWFGMQALYGALNLTDPTGGGGVAYFAHIGGFIFGLLTIRLLATKRKRVPGMHPAL